MPSMDLLYRLAASLDVRVSDVFSIADNREHDEQQLALNSLYITLPTRERDLLFAFAKLLQDRDQQDVEALSMEPVILPVMFGDSTDV